MSQNIDDWYNGPDPILGAMIIASRCTELTAGDCLRSGLVPLGLQTGVSPFGVINRVRISDRDPDRIARAKQFIEDWNNENNQRQNTDAA